MSAYNRIKKVKPVSDYDTGLFYDSICGCTFKWMTAAGLLFSF